MGLQSNFEWSKATFILCSCVFQLFRKYRYLLRSGTANNAETYSSVTFYTRPLPTFTVHTKNPDVLVQTQFDKWGEKKFVTVIWELGFLWKLCERFNKVSWVKISSLLKGLLLKGNLFKRAYQAPKLSSGWELNFKLTFQGSKKREEKDTLTFRIFPFWVLCRTPRTYSTCTNLIWKAPRQLPQRGTTQ